MRVSTAAVAALVIPLSIVCVGCSGKAPAVANASAGNSTISGEGNGTAPVQAPVAKASVSALGSHEYVSKEDNLYYYKADDGTLVGAKDLGRLPQNQDFSGLLLKGERAVQFEGGVFAAVAPGSDVVHISRHLPNEQILRPVGNVPLSGDSVAAKALRDSIAGRLTFPSEAAIDAQAKAQPAAAQPATTGNQDDSGVSSARPDDYKE